MKTSHTTPYGKLKLYRPNLNKTIEPVMLVAGYSETLTHTKKLVDTLSRTGYDAFTYTTPSRRGRTGLTDPIARQGDIVLRVLDIATKEHQKVHAVAHSLGCAAVLYAAMEAPERFASITLMQPLGMVGEQSFGELLKRVGRKVLRNTLGAMRGRHLTYEIQNDTDTPLDKETRLRYSMRVARSQLAGAGVLARHPRLAIQEAKAAGKYDISEGIKQVVEAGIPVHLVTAYGDEMFDWHKVEVGYEIITDQIASHRPLSDLSATHDTFWLHPERSAFLIGKIIQHPDI